MALQVYGDISRTAGHAHETTQFHGWERVEFTTLSEICLMQATCMNAHKHAMLAAQVQMAIEAGCLFLDMACGVQSSEAEAMHLQVEQAKPFDLQEGKPEFSVHPDDVNGVFEWCMDHLEPGYGGPERPAVRAMLALAHRMEKTERFAALLNHPEQVDDPMLAAVAQACSTTPNKPKHGALAWRN